MLDLSDIPLVDNHCHPVLLDQQMDLLRFRSYFTEAADPGFVQRHVGESVYYLWLVRQATAFYGCPASEEELIAARNTLESDALLARLLQAANFAALVIDTGFPEGPHVYSPERMGELGHCRAARLFRLEPLMQRLVMAYSDFDEMVAHYEQEVSTIRERGYCGFKSIVAYRSGLNILEWTKDEAVAAFAQARAEGLRQGTLRINHKPLLDYLLHIAFHYASQQKLPVQFHTGYGDSDTNLLLGNPLHLRNIMEREDYRGMAIVLLHESYPYVQLGAYLAAIYPHVYFDLSYCIPFVDRLEMLAFTRQALGVAPVSKLVYSSDGIHLPEMHWAAALRGRAILAQVLQEMIDADELDYEQARHMAQLILHDNAWQLYGLSD
ncbi:amidohydrolase family protein [Thermogemmatispora carboxidivorans]|uniref:amidohydrolase family protein n=1 Tax=Thermogemmatispora carboxidivorans TaxID=1382306 RepID=UPI0006999C3A|nr:amidohydrolase family protein [Thermogemmatispora carboxidivorans]